MRRWGLLAIASLLSAASPAFGADMPAPPPILELPRFISPGWYLRLDAGYAWGVIGGAESATGFADPQDNKLGGGFAGGVGAGFRSDWLRTDLTLDYTGPLKYEGSVAASGDTTAKVDAVTALFNVYLDLGTWYHATPYIGAGLGATQLHVYDYASNAAPPFTSGLSHTQWNVAWAAMAGVAYPAAPNILLDVGYRYVGFGDVTTASDAAGAMTLKNLAAHEVRVGIRWSFDDSPVPR